MIATLLVHTRLFQQFLSAGMALLLCLLRILHASHRPSQSIPEQTHFRNAKQAPYPPEKRFKAAPKPRSGGRKKPAWVVEEVLKLFVEKCVSYRQTMLEFNRLHAHEGMTVCLNTVYTWVQKYLSEEAAIRKETRNRFPEQVRANLRWGLDGTGKADATSIQHFILTMIDYGSRLSLAMVRLENADARAILAAIYLAAEKFGKPRIIRTDNAAVFKSAAFEEGLAALGIRHEFTAQGKPWENGRAERLFWTLKEKLNRIIPENAAALDSLLAEFNFWYNAVRPHQHLHGYTPAEVWMGINPYNTAPKAVMCFEGWSGLLRGFYMRR